MTICLVILIITFFILTLYSIVQANIDLFHFEDRHFFALKILDTSSAASLFVTLVGALLVRHQFAIGVLPRINYKSTISAKYDKQSQSESYETWRVEIRNTGLGSAIIERTEYVLEVAMAKRSFHVCAFDDIIKELVKLNLVHNRDYWLEHITTGFSLSPKDDCFVFEIKTEQIEKLKRFSMVLYFQGQLGDRYSREISLIPRL